MELYKKVKKFVINSSKGSSTKHYERTTYWIKQLKPNADEALLIAAIAHDIERVFRDKKKTYYEIRKKKVGMTDKNFLDYHQTTSAKIIGNFLEKHNADKNLIKRVKMLVSKHEVGGNKNQNLLKDADSISFFENNLKDFLKNKLKIFGKQKIRQKFDWMYDRITSRKAKQIAKKWYEKAIKELEES